MVFQAVSTLILEREGENKGCCCCCLVSSRRLAVRLFLLRSAKYLIPSKRVRKKWRINLTVSSRPNPSHRSRPNFASSLFLSSVISQEKRERNHFLSLAGNAEVVTDKCKYAVAFHILSSRLSRVRLQT